MEKRRVQCTGGSSFSITLPKKWVESHRIREKDEVTLLPRGTGSLILRPPSGGSQTQRRTIDVGGLSDEEIRREVIALYITGAEEAEITGRAISRRERLAVRSAAEMVMGFEAIEESSRSILLRNMISPEKFSIRSGIEKMFSIARAMFQDAIGAFAAGDRTLAQDVIARDFDLDKLYFLVLRQNHSLMREQISEETMGLSMETARYYAIVAVQLERIGDHAVKISRTVGDGRKKTNAGPRLGRLLRDALKKLLPLFDAAAEFTLAADKKAAHRTLNDIVGTEDEVHPLYDEAISNGPTGAAIVADSIDRFRGYVANMAEAAIDHSFVEAGR